MAAASPQTPRTNFDRAVSAKQSADALKQMRQQQAAFKTPPPKVETPAATSAWVNRTVQAGPRPTTTVYYVERNHYYDSIGWHMPVYVNYGAPSYGVWDAMFLWMMLDLHHDWAYYHYDDPAYIAWRRDAERQAQDNAELRAKLAAMDRDVAALKERGVPQDPTYVPAGVKPEVALAAEVVTGVTAPKLAFATGVPEGTYSKLCEAFKKSASETMEVDCQNTAGSRENVMNFLAKKDPAIFATADVIDWALRAESAGGNGPKSFGRNQLTAYDELMFLLVNKDSKIRNVTDLKPGAHTLYVGPQGSGTEISYQNLAHHASQSSYIFFSAHNTQYEGIDIKNAPYTDAIHVVANDPNAAMLVMMPGRSEFVSQVDEEFGNRVRLVRMNGDSSFDRIKDRDGNYVYHECELQGGLYPKLLGASAARTLCVQAVVVVSEDWVERYGQTAEDVFLTAWEFTRPELDRADAGVKRW